MGMTSQPNLMMLQKSDDDEPVHVDMELALERNLQHRLPPKEKTQEQVVFSSFLPSLGLFRGRGCISAGTVTLGLWAASASFFSVSASFLLQHVSHMRNNSNENFIF